MNVSRAGDNIIPHIKVAIYGPSGAGKTTLGAGAYVKSPAGVAVVCAEKQAKAIISTWNPDALVLEVHTIADVQAAWSLLKRGFATGTLWTPTGPEGAWVDSGEPFGIETVVLDSASDIFRTFKSEQLAIEREAAERRAKARKGGSDLIVEDDLGQHGWDVLQRRFMDTMRAFRDLPCHVVALWAQDERDENRETTFRPFLQGRDLKSNLPGLFNAVGYISRIATPPAKDGDPPGVRRVVSFALDERFTTKTLDGLGAVEPASFKAWVQKFVAHRAELSERRRKLRAEQEEAARAAANEARGPQEPPAEQERGEEPPAETTPAADAANTPGEQPGQETTP